MDNNYHIRFENISKYYGDVKIIEGLNLDIKKGEFISLLGPSGSGKTTLLMMLAGFESATKGTVWLNDTALNDIPSYKRNIGVVFQNYALFPHMTVAQNIAFPLQMRGMDKTTIKEKVDKVLDMVQLSAMKERKPSQLSGGQQQRVALARALVFEPEVILMDEPLGALDKQLREQMQLDIRALHQRLGVTIVFVTHDQEEALTMSDRIAVFNKGNIEQIASPREIYDFPKTKFVAQFIGATNLLEGKIIRIEGDKATVLLPSSKKVVVTTPADSQVNQDVYVSIRPEKIRLGQDATAFDNHVESSVVDSVYLGNHLRIQLDEKAHGFIVNQDRKAAEWGTGDKVVVGFNADDSWVIKR